MGQKARVRSVLEEANRPLALHEIGNRIARKFRTRDAETAISARIRELRYEMEKDGLTIHSERAGPGKQHHLYRVVNARKAVLL